MPTPPATPLLAAIAAAAITLAARAQPADSVPAEPQSQPDTQPETQPDIQPEPSPTVESLQEDLADTPTSELSIRLAPLPLAELRQVADAAIADLRTVAGRLAAAMVAQQRADTDGEAMTPEQKAALDQRVADLVTRKAELATRTNVVLDAIEAKGGEVAQDRAYLSVVQNLQPVRAAAQEPDGAPEPAAPEPTEEQQRQAALDARVAEIVGDVRDLPPIHERPEPWTVPLTELELELQPLRKDEIAKRVEAWLAILQRQVRERIRTDIALTSADEPALRQRLADRSARQQQVVIEITKRLEKALLILQKRGGDVSEYRRYVASATGQRLNLTDPAVLYAQSMAWLKSRDGGLAVAFSIAKFLAILLLTWILSRMLGKAVGTAIRRIPKASSLLQDFVVGSVKRVTLLIGLVIGIYYLGVNITPLVAAIGAAGLVIGLALQGTLSNFASGLLILIYRPYDVGDVINGGGVSGKVEAMNLVSTRICTFDNQVMIVPNNAIWNDVITNITGRDTRRVDLTFGISYKADIAKAVAILEETMAAHEKTLEEPAPMVRVASLGDNSVNLIARPWAKTSDYWDVYWDLMRQVKERFDAEGINIPFPQRDLHVPETIQIRLAPNGLDAGRPGGHVTVPDHGSQQPSNEPGTDEEGREP